MTTEVQVCAVQQASNCFRRRSCKRELDTRVQQPQGLLNTRQTCAACEAVTRESYPHWPKGWCGDFPVLNRETASCHTVAGTWLASLRRVLALGHARKLPSHRPTGKVNDRAFMGMMAVGFRWLQTRRRQNANLPRATGDSPNAGKQVAEDSRLLVRFQPCLPEPCGFPFLSHFRSGCWKRVAEPRECSMFSLGGFLCFPLFPFVLCSIKAGK